MPSHVWGDKWFKRNGKDLGQAINFCMTNWRRYARLGSMGKEKYGTFRHHPSFYNAEWPIHELVKPGYVYYRWPRSIMLLELKLGYVVRTLRIDQIVRKYQEFVYNAVLQIACKKWSKIKHEILDDGADRVADLVRPGIFGPIDGKKVHDKYWTTYKAKND